jgi:hypothetical protein
MVHYYFLPAIFELAVSIVKVNLDEQTEHRTTSWIANLLSKILRHEVNYDFQFTENDIKYRFICVATVKKTFLIYVPVILLIFDDICIIKCLDVTEFTGAIP